MMKWRGRSPMTGLVVTLVVAGCGDTVAPPDDPDAPLFRIPVVVLVIHEGEPVGVGHNLSEERVLGQIRTLNEDYRRKEGTPGFNTHPDGGDTRIEFVLARVAPDGSPTNGIHRVDATLVDNPVEPNRQFDYYAHFGYWDHTRYLNVWTMPLPAKATDVVLGIATGPNTDLPGANLFEKGEPHQAEGVLVNSAHFGASDIDSPFNLGRTLTHEVGHYLGLLHPWGRGDCEENDFCADTPPVSAAVTGCPTGAIACDGSPIMAENYMNYTNDACMSTFTNDQIVRLHYVLRNSPERVTLLDSPGLGGLE